MHELLPFTELLNRLFAGPANAILHALGIHPTHPEAPISNFVAMEFLVFLLLVCFFLFVRSRLSVDKPGASQHAVEVISGFVKDQSNEIIGHHSEGYTSFLVALGLFILACNLLGMVPWFESPTAVPSVPLGCAILAFLFYNIAGIRKQGPLKYAAHFAGPMPALAPLMIPIEIISHLARVLSLTIRLFANIFAGDMVTLVFFSLVPIGIPVIFLGLHVAVSFLQAYIFVLLTTVYLAGAVAEEH
jgi:F-type H+-transporting ATPase subunit a